MQRILSVEMVTDKTQCRAIGVVFFIVAISLGAFVRIPLGFTPVPLTLQTFFVLLCAASLGRRLAAYAVSGYLFCGLFGLTVFTGAGSGYLYLAGPTGGYLLGFLVAAVGLGGYLGSGNRSWSAVFLSMCAASIMILAVGSMWLKLLLGYPMSKALLLGLVPFLAGDTIKSLVASAVYLAMRPRLREIF